jgi:hypothetical protein
MYNYNLIPLQFIFICFDYLFGLPIVHIMLDEYDLTVHFVFVLQHQETKPTTDSHSTMHVVNTNVTEVAC